MRSLRGRLTASVVAAAMSAAGAVAVASPALAADEVVLATGHTDAVDVHYTNGKLELKVKDDTVSPAATRDPADVTFQVLPAARTEVPDIDAFAFLGAPGTPIWMLPQVQDPALLWPGWNTTELSSGVLTGDKVTISLVGVEGPGAVTLFDTSSLGEPNIRFRSADGLPDRLEVPVHTHAHASWVFGAEGRYTLKWQADATLANGTKVSTGPVDYDFVVGELPGDDPVELSVSGLASSYQAGQQVTLQAVQTPQGALTTYQWFSKGPDDADFTAITGETSAAYSFTAAAALDGTQFQVRLYDGQTVVATSGPVTLEVGAGQGGGSDTSKIITASVNADDGALVISVAPEDRTVTLPAAKLSSSGDRWETSGMLKPVTVTDTRGAQPGWTASGQIAGGFKADGGAGFGADALDWTPVVTSQGEQQGVVAGAPSSLGEAAVLASAAAGKGRGTAKLDAQLKLNLPTETAAGVYTGTLTLTAI